MLKAITRQTAAVDSKIAAINSDGRRYPISTANFFDHHAKAEDVAVIVSEEDFLAANQELVPSVSAGELARYETMRASFEGTSDGASTQNGADMSRPPNARIVSGSSTVSKGKGKAVVRDKGKGKALAADSEEEYGPDDEGNGTFRRPSKGKGKAVASFEQATASDDDGLY